jgi:biotin carboxyl carrier protein
MSNFEFLFDGEPVTSQCEQRGGDFVVTVGESEFQFTPVGENLFATRVNGRRCVVGAVGHDGTFHIDINSVLLEVTEPSEDGFAGGAGGQMGEMDKIFAPMPGKIVKIQVAVGDEVVEKQPMVIVEAMKMENQVVARAKGTVKAVNFAAGDQVDTETPIIELDLAEE